MQPVLGVITFLTLSRLVFGEEDYCIAPNEKAGVCVPISDCEKLKNLIKGSIADRQLINQWHCGFDGEVPKVCCLQSKNTCFTLEATQGKCVDIQDCPELAKRLKQPTKSKDLEYVQRSRCVGSDKNSFSVCCERPSDRNSTDSFEQLYRNAASTTCNATGLPDPTTSCCGVDASSGNRIIQGTPAAIDQYPWLALIEYTRPYVCGGSLISSRYVITAAHCVVTEKKADRGALRVRLGEYNTTNPDADCIDVEGGGQDCNDGIIVYDIVGKIVHEEYNTDASIVQANDIALLKLNDSAPFTDFIRPICLPMSDLTQAPPIDLRFFIAGWGAVDEFRSTSDVKLHALVPHMNLTKCRALYSQKGVPLIWNKQICAGGEFNRDSCKGDSGGPLMHLNDKKYELTGIISFGALQCGSKGNPSIYTKVHEYIPWIKSKISS